MPITARTVDVRCPHCKRCGGLELVPLVGYKGLTWNCAYCGWEGATRPGAEVGTPRNVSYPGFRKMTRNVEIGAEVRIRFSRSHDQHRVVVTNLSKNGKGLNYQVACTCGWTRWVRSYHFDVQENTKEEQ